MELEPPLDYQFPLDGDFHQWSIGVIGAGFIVRDCHLPAYRAAGFHVAGICSRTAARASEVADARGIERVYADYLAMLADPQINVIDIAVPPQFQLDVVREVVQHADHVRGILAQKPLAWNALRSRPAAFGRNQPLSRSTPEDWSWTLHGPGTRSSGISLLLLYYNHNQFTGLVIIWIIRSVGKWRGV